MRITTTATRPFEIISIDIVDLPRSLLNYKYLLTYQCNLTKFVGAIPLITQDADSVARAFVHQIILKHGMNQNLTVLSDQGANFLSELFKNICKLLKIKKIQTTAFRPQGNYIERSHSTLKDFLRCHINQDLDNWDTFIDYAVFTFNSSKNEATTYSPYQLLYGYEVSIPTSLQKKPDTVYNYDNYYYELRYRLQRSHEIARESQLKTKYKTKANYDHKLRPLNVKLGDQVLLINNAKRGPGMKLQPHYCGPYTIIELISPTNVKIRLGRRDKIVHKNLLKPFYRQE